MIWEHLAARIDLAPQSVAIHTPAGSITYGELGRIAGRIAARLPAVDGGPRPRALIRQADSFSLLVQVLACWRRGAVPVLLRETSTDAHRDELVRLLRPAAVLTDRIEPTAGGGPPPASARRRFDPRDEALVISTSGTTGAPKLVALPAEAVCINAAAIASRLRFSEEDRVVVSTPLSYMYGLMGGSMAALWAGASVHLHQPGAPLSEVQADLRRNRLTVVQGPPSLMRLFFAYWNGRPFPAVRLFTTGGEAAAAGLADSVRAAFPCAEGRFLYGMTEAGPRISDDDLFSGRFVHGGVGRPYAHLRWRIEPHPAPGLPAGTGRLVLQGPSMFLGYLQADGTYTGLNAAGEFPTSDLVSADADGRLSFQGRVDRIFKSGGRLVNPAAVESAALQLPGIAAARCRASGHPLLGFVPVLEVEVHPGADVDAEAIRAHCAGILDAQALPGEIRIGPGLALNESGKARLP